ncbi:hypothetical protein ABCR94_02695 [Streptomyces sp. 21So2-11]|uniref:hypothetical protein n=1 Tax=Streptomyces sp. 21So2-11 TaxID=3144408 RepID=UPI00321ADAC9
MCASVNGAEQGDDVVRGTQFFARAEGNLVRGQPGRCAFAPVAEGDPHGWCPRRGGQDPRTY